MPFKTLIVGLGQIGMGYDLALDGERYVLSHARAYTQHARFELLAGVDQGEAPRAAFTQHYARPAYPDLAGALAAHTPDVVVIAAPTPLHWASVQQVLALMQGRLPRAILCEKPLAYELDEARAMVAACAAQGVALYINYIRRSDAGAIEIRRRLEAGEIAGPLKGVCWYSKGFQHNGSHFFNLLQWWLGPMQRFAVIERGRLWNGEEAEPDVQVHFRDGAITFLAAREEAFSHYTIELLAANGRLRYEQGGKTVLWQAAGPDPLLPAYTVLAAEPQRLATGLDRYQWHVAEQLAQALDGAPAALCSGAEALATLEDMQQILDRCAASAA